MNRKDCEHIGYLLSSCKTREELLEGLFQLDPRIKAEMLAFDEVQGQDKATMQRYNDLMAAEYGERWVWSKRAREENRQSEIMQQARKEMGVA